MKLIIIIFLSLIITPIVIVLVQFLMVLPQYTEIEYNRGNFATCSWLKVIPKDWKCTDNWHNRQRHVLATNGYQSIELFVHHPDFPIAKTCQRIFPASIPHRPSASALSLPFWCSGDEKSIIANWQQDNFNYRLISKNVPRELFLINLDMVGKPVPEEYFKVVNTEGGVEEGKPVKFQTQ